MFRKKLILLIIISCLLGFHSQSLASEQNHHILILGDSLSSGLGVEPEQAYPYLVLEKFKENDINIKITNGSISGSTTAGSLARLKWFHRIRPDVMILALGANDGMRGLSTEEMFQNLESCILYAKEKNITIILAGMKIPPNYGEEYTQRFEQVYSDLAKKHTLALIPFLLEGVAGESSLNQADGIHPNAEGHKIMAQTVYAKIMEQI